MVSGEYHAANDFPDCEGYAPMLTLWHHQTWQLKIVYKCVFHGGNPLERVDFPANLLAMFDYQRV